MWSFHSTDLERTWKKCSKVPIALAELLFCWCSSWRCSHRSLGHYLETENRIYGDNYVTWKLLFYCLYILRSNEFYDRNGGGLNSCYGWFFYIFMSNNFNLDFFFQIMVMAIRQRKMQIELVWNFWNPEKLKLLESQQFCELCVTYAYKKVNLS